MKELSKGARLILWLSERSESLLLTALRAGASDYLSVNDPQSDVIESIKSLAVRRRWTADRLPSQSLSRIVGESPGIRNVRSALPRMAASDCNLLITGETGTGKDLVAELIHRNSRRSRGPFVCLNCAAFPDALLESELFGHARGAFTGAATSRQGKLEFANYGTIFLDEIGEMTPFAQAKILRAVESREIQRLGSNDSVPINVRIIAATNQDLPAMVSAKTFRRDLFFRLNVARLHLPPLRERKQDIGVLFKYYVSEVAKREGMNPLPVTDAALKHLSEYDWPGNIRELKNLVEAVFISAPEDRIDSFDLPDWIDGHVGEFAAAAAAGADAAAAASDRVEDDRSRLLEALRSTGWNKSKAAEKLNWSRMTLYRKLSRYGLNVDPAMPQLA